MRVTYLCDFDGTVAPSDIGRALVERFSPGDPERRRDLLALWRSGAIGHRELTVGQCGMMRVTAAEALAFARGFGLDPHFAGFARAVLARGDRVLIVSEGFDFYVQDQLDRAGLGDLPWAANRARFEGDRMIPSFPHGAAPDEAGSGCGRCGNCKAQHARRARAAGDQVVLVGDGLSDRCAAELADTVLARDGLLAWCRERGIAAVPFDDFAGVAAFALDSRAGAGRAAPPAAPGSGVTRGAGG
jgi:2-hydroxy-3-keto-5-methylthiopentenyl-1-phosphate phosphatase